MKKVTTAQYEMAMAHHREKLFRAKSYSRYMWLILRESRLYQRLLNFWINFRRYRLISRIISVLATILTITGTGAAMLIFLLLCLLLLPIIALLSGGTTLLGLFRRKKENQRLRAEVKGRTVFLFFPGALEENSFSAATMKYFSELPQSTVFVISPHIWSPKGLGGRGFYINTRCEGKHLFLLRRHYFFFFRKLLDERFCKRIVVILS